MSILLSNRGREIFVLDGFIKVPWTTYDWPTDHRLGNTVINECVGSLSEAAKATFPNNSTLKKTICRKRKEIQMVPHNPVDLTTLDIPPTYTMYSSSNGNKEIFLQSDSGPGSNRILIVCICVIKNERFTPEICNLYDKVLNSENRTNNHAEAANRRLNIEMGILCELIIYMFKLPPFPIGTLPSARAIPHDNTTNLELWTPSPPMPTTWTARTSSPCRLSVCVPTVPNYNGPCA
ncbi:hypothetical protein AGLY_006831 [Aphis glycines]|uniref:Uncharacterized protein n=1 Tax=Aphis glycines TaxID=307491 RepID=A0A6G0TRM3_APHGL|nr:hypothetical protein AGLY_006831 [Aphis glycines]